MSKIRCLVVDDEPLALKQLATYVERIPSLELVGQCSSAVQALEFMRTHEIDLLFTDISMPDMSGMELVRQVAGRCHVVFTTAYANFAVEGYKVEAVDYLLKPFGLADVVSAAERVEKRMSAVASPTAEAPTTEERAADRVLTKEDYVFVKNDSKMSRIRVADIMLVEGMSEYVRIYAVGEARPLTTLLSMKRVEASLPADVFMRVHRSWIVNLERIESVSHLRISIAGQLVPVSDNYKDRFTAYLDSHAIR